MEMSIFAIFMQTKRDRELHAVTNALINLLKTRALRKALAKIYLKFWRFNEGAD